MNIDTICVRGAGGEPDYTGAVSAPIYQTATFAHIAVGESTGFDYSRSGNPTRNKAESLVSALEGGAGAAAFSTGMAAVSACMELFSPGDHIIASDDLYGGSFRFFKHISAKNGLEFDFVDTSDADEISARIKKNTKALYIETPTNPTLQVTDIAKRADIANSHNLILIVDNTFLTPYFQRPLSLGADIVIHSGTKYLAGHNDTLAGFLVAKDAGVIEKIRFIGKTTGSCLSPFDSWLVIRGIKTLALRMERIEKNARLAAEWLKTRREVKKVFYTGFSDHPQYEISKRQSDGFGGIISFEVENEETAVKILNNIKLIYFAESLGGTESLMTYPFLQTHADVPEEIRRKKGVNERFLRLSAGIENIDDIISDLEQALL